MKRWKLAVLLVLMSLVSFLCGGIFFLATWHIIALSEVDPRVELENLQVEAAVFFYGTMRELFAETYDPQDDRVSTGALVEFNTYRACLEPRCWLVNVHESYGAFYGYALFPSGDVFEAGMTKTDKGWVLAMLNHMGTKYFFHDLSEATWKENGQEREGPRP